jgi:aspartate 1-decarboxylase
VSNGKRFTTYAIRTFRGSREIRLNGVAARLAMIGILLIIDTYRRYKESELASYHSVVALVDGDNRASES